ncbi:hypothetical protein H5410_051411 [Solanum commersonii]|uniref:Uncharacterized protein n=1 Tax=Solanum commersonii TaxID=4109 RepID=A0A9J5X0W3_SOLCO|nr:hypothetical protein H5410_051411 [Solanum commersonii]
MVTIHQFKATKEKNLFMLDQVIKDIALLCKSKLLKKEYYCSIQATHEMVWPYQATKEKHLIMPNQAIKESTLLCQSKLLKERYYCSIQATNEMVWPYKVMLSCELLSC